MLNTMIFFRKTPTNIHSVLLQVTQILDPFTVWNRISVLLVLLCIGDSVCRKLSKPKFSSNQVPCVNGVVQTQTLGKTA